METGVLVVVLCVVVGGFAAQWLAWRLALPGIVVLLAAGLLAGPATGLLNPSEAFGSLLRPVIGLAVAIIVFEGGLSLDLRELRAAGNGVLRLTAVALPLNWLAGAAAGHFVGGLEWPAALLFGSILVVTGPTVILPLLRQAKLKPRIGALLKWEAIVNDPVGAVLSVVVLEVLVLVSAGAADAEALTLEVGLGLVAAIVVAVGLGVGAALLVAWSFRRDQVPEVLKTPMLLSLTLGIYSVSNVLMEEAGLIAATVFGVALANLGIAGLQELRRFKEGLVVLIVSGLFIVLTADLDPEVLARLSWPILALTLTVLFVVRPAAILLATIGARMRWNERLLVAWIAPRGIVAAAVAGVAGLRLGGAGYEGAELIQPTVFAVIAATVVAHGFSLSPLARRLGLTTGDRPGLMIVGASDWTIGLAGTLDRLGVPVLLVDSFPGALRGARRRNLPTLQAEILSEHAEQRLAGYGMDYLLAATPDEIYNALVCVRHAPEFGRERVYQLAPAGGHPDPHRGTSRDWRGKVLADVSLRADLCERRYAEGWRFVAVGAEDAPPLDAPDHGGRVPVLVVRRKGGLVFLSPESGRPDLEDGDRLILFQAAAAARE